MDKHLINHNEHHCEKYLPLQNHRFFHLINYYDNKGLIKAINGEQNIVDVRDNILALFNI